MKNCVPKGNRTILQIAQRLSVDEDFVRTVAQMNPDLSDQDLFVESAKILNRISLNTNSDGKQNNVTSGALLNHIKNQITGDATVDYGITESAVEVSLLNGKPLIKIDDSLTTENVDRLIEAGGVRALLQQTVGDFKSFGDVFSSTSLMQAFLLRYASLVVKERVPNIFDVDGVNPELIDIKHQKELMKKAYSEAKNDVNSNFSLTYEVPWQKERVDNVKKLNSVVTSLGILDGVSGMNPQILSFLGIDMSVHSGSDGIFFSPVKRDTSLTNYQKQIAVLSIIGKYLENYKKENPDFQIPEIKNGKNLEEVFESYINALASTIGIAPTIKNITLRDTDFSQLNHGNVIIASQVLLKFFADNLNLDTVNILQELNEKMQAVEMGQNATGVFQDSDFKNLNNFLNRIYDEFQKQNNSLQHVKEVSSLLSFATNPKNENTQEVLKDATFQDTSAILKQITGESNLFDLTDLVSNGKNPFVAKILPNFIKVLRDKVKDGSSNFNESTIAFFEKIFTNNSTVILSTVQIKYDFPEGIYGGVDPVNGIIYLSDKIPNIPSENINFENVLIHELLHLATVRAPNSVKQQLKIFLNSVNSRIVSDIKKDAKKTKEYKSAKNKEAYIKKLIAQFYSDHRFQSLLKPDEFIADFFRTPQIAEMLNEMDATGTVKVREKSFFATIIDIIKKLFKLKSSDKVTALDEASQLISDAVTSSSQEFFSYSNETSELKKRMKDASRLNSANLLFRSGKHVNNIEWIPKVLNKLSGDLLETMVKKEIGIYRGISPILQYVYHLYETDKVLTKDIVALNQTGAFSPEFLKRVMNYMENDNFKGLSEFTATSLKTAFSVRDKVLVVNGGKVVARPVVKYNNSFYSIVNKKNGNLELNNLNSKEKIEVTFTNGKLIKVDNKEVLTNVYSPALFTEIPPSRDSLMLHAYDNNIAKVYEKERVLAREISFMIDEALQEKQKTVPTMTREKFVSNLSYADLETMVYAKLQYYSDNANDSNREAVGLFSEHIDALLYRALPHLQFTEGIMFNTKIKTEKIKDGKNKNSDDTINTTEASETSNESEEEGDDVANSTEVQNVQFNMKADSKKIFDRISVKMKNVLYNLTDMTGNVEEVTGSLLPVDINFTKDVLLEALDEAFDVEDIMDILEYYEEFYPFIGSLISQIEEDPTIKTQLYNSFVLSRVDAVVIDPEMDKPFQKINHTYLRAKKVKDWAGNISDALRINPKLFLTSKVGLQDIHELLNAVRTINTHVSGVITSLKNFNKLSLQEKENAHYGILEEFYYVVTAIGIDVSKERLTMHFRSILNGNDESLKDFTKMAIDIQKSLVTLETKINNGENFTSKQLADILMGSVYYKLYRILSKIDYQKGESYVSEQGKGYYLNRQPSYVAKILAGFRTNQPWLTPSEKIERRNEFLQKHFYRFIGTYTRNRPIEINGRRTRFFSDLVHRLVHDHEFANNNRYASFKNYASGLGADFSKLKEADQLIIFLSAYFTDETHNPTNEVGEDVPTTEAYFPIPTLSDSPELGFMKGIRYTGDSYRQDIVSNLTQLAISELQRILIVRKGKKKGEMPNVANLYKRGELFIKFPFLESIKEEIIGLIESDPLMAVVKIKDAVGRYLEGKAETFASTFVSDQGFTDYVSDELEKLIGVTENLPEKYLEQKERLINYYYNQYNAYAEFTHLLGTDPALYKNPVDFQKRFKQIYSHGIPLDTEATVAQVKYDNDTGTVVTTGEQIKVGKKKRVTVVVSDYTVFSNISDNMIKFAEKTFTDPIQRARVITILGAYNYAEVKIGEDTYARNIIAGTYYKNGTPILSTEYIEATKDELETRYYADLTGKDPVLYETEKMNITDGQTILSFSEMRSMMSMYSNWDNSKEADYQKYLASKGTVEVFDDVVSEFYNNIKSFYFNTDAVKVGDVNLKNNIQFKHSESLLLPNNIMAGSELLKAISNFLENPPQVIVDGEVYEVGAISFDSTQKVGSFNVVDLNNVPASDVETHLRESVAAGNYVVTDYNSYIIQQPSKNHITNNKRQLVGTQTRRILYSGISENTKFEIQGEFYSKEEYIDILNNLINYEIKNSFEKLKRRFNNNKALSALLIDTVMSDKLYAKDLVNAFTLDGNGNFKLPLFNPANAIMVERMITSIIRNNLTKQFIRGGKVINTSNVGYDESLKIEFKRDGDRFIPTFFEMYLPFPGTEKQWKELHDENGNFMWDKVDPKFKEMVFYRIPTEGTYSVIPGRVKKFLPPSSGTSIYLPNEILALTGLDFDIDAMYGFIYDYSFKNGTLEVIKSSRANDFLSEELKLRRNPGLSDVKELDLSISREVGFTPEPKENPVNIDANFPKDQVKANYADGIIGYGSHSTGKYAAKFGGTRQDFSPGETIMISVNGQGRPNQKENVALTKRAIDLALSKGVTAFIADNANVATNVHNRSGEGVIREYLLSKGLQYTLFKGVGLYTVTQNISEDIKGEPDAHIKVLNEEKEAKQVRINKLKADVILPIGTSGSGKSTFIKSLPQENLVVIEPDAMRVEFTGDMNDKSKDKEIYEEAAKRAIAALKETETPSQIYSKLGNKTKKGNIVIQSVYQKAGVQYAESIGGVFSLRVNGTNNHFGNPFSDVESEIQKGLIRTKSTRESVEKYIEWVLSPTTNIKPEQHKFIRDWLQSGKLKGKPIVYYKELGEPSHATALDYLINKYDWNEKSKQVVFDTTNLTKDKRLPFIEAIKKAFPNANIQYKLMELNPELAKQRIKTQLARGENRANVSDATIDRHAESYKQALLDIKDEPISDYDESQAKISKLQEDIKGIDNKINNINSKNAAILNALSKVTRKQIIEKVRELEEQELVQVDCTGGLKAEDGLRTSFTKGGEWKVIKDLKGYPTHSQGGVDLTISKTGVTVRDGNTSFMAKHGLVIPKN